VTGAVAGETGETAGDKGPGRTGDRRHLVSDYFRLERWEIPPPDGSDAPSEFGGRAPVDDFQRGAGGGLVTGGLLTLLDTLGGFTSGLAVLPEWIVTTSMMASIAALAQVGPLRLHAKVLRRGRNAVVAGCEVFDEGAGDRRVAAATMTSSVLDPGAMDIGFERPFSNPMPPLDPGAPGPEEFFGIEPGGGARTRLVLEDDLRNPWGILHGGAVAMLADVAACRAVEASSGRGGAVAADTVLHYLRPAKVGPIEARCDVLGIHAGRAVVRVGIHDLGAADRLVTVASVVVLSV
jgi:uncharacterized protein (TIGR00369 family)